MSKNKINIVVAGATGYVGLDLIYWLSKHKKINIKNLCAQKKIGKQIKFFDKRIVKPLPKITKLSKVLWNDVDLLFLSLPNGESQKLLKKLYKFNKLKFIDLSADFRIQNTSDYKKWYGKTHLAKKIQNKSIYSISEFVKEKIKNFRIISNPGCYPTSIQLALVPLLKNKNLIDNKNIIIDSKSGYSGAGKGFEKKFKHKNLFQSIYAYAVNKHRHMGELDQQFKIIDSEVEYTFNPYLIPTYRGILSSMFVTTKKKKSAMHILNELRKTHKNNKFLKICKLNEEIGTGDVINTNFCKISVCETRYKNKVIIFSAIDNLVKGASGQAIQNMNLLFGFKENEGLNV